MELSIASTIQTCEEVIGSKAFKRVTDMLIGMGMGGPLESRAEAIRAASTNGTTNHCNGVSLPEYLYTVLSQKMPRLLQFHRDLTAIDTVGSVAAAREMANTCPDLEALLAQGQPSLDKFAQFWGLASNADGEIDRMVADLQQFAAGFAAVAQR